MSFVIFQFYFKSSSDRLLLNMTRSVFNKFEGSQTHSRLVLVHILCFKFLIFEKWGFFIKLRHDLQSHKAIKIWLLHLHAFFIFNFFHTWHFLRFPDFLSQKGTDVETQGVEDLRKIPGKTSLSFQAHY